MKSKCTSHKPNICFSIEQELRSRVQNNLRIHVLCIEAEGRRYNHIYV